MLLWQSVPKIVYEHKHSVWRGWYIRVNLSNDVYTVRGTCMLESLILQDFLMPSALASVVFRFELLNFHGLVSFPLCHWLVGEPAIGSSFIPALSNLTFSFSVSFTHVSELTFEDENILLLFARQQ